MTTGKDEKVLRITDININVDHALMTSLVY